MQAGYWCACSVTVVQVYSRVCSRPSTFTSRRDTTSRQALISRQFLFLVQKFHFRLIPKNYREYHWYFRNLIRLGFPEHLLVPEKDAAAVLIPPSGCSLPGLYTTGLAPSPLSVPVGLVCHKRSSNLVG